MDRITVMCCDDRRRLSDPGEVNGAGGEDGSGTGAGEDRQNDRERRCSHTGGTAWCAMC